MVRGALDRHHLEENGLRLLLIVAAAFLPTQAPGADCLDRAVEFAQKVCGEIQRSGATQVIEANGQLKASISGIIRRVLGEVDVGGGGKSVRESYENVLRQDLSKELFNIRDCRMKMVEVGKVEACRISGETRRSNNELTDARSQSGTAPTLSPDEVILHRMANEFNLTAPAVIDRVTQIDSVKAGPGLRLTYFATTSEADRAVVLNFINNRLKLSVCTQPDLRQLLDSGVTVAYSYRSISGAHIATGEYAARDCS